MEASARGDINKVNKLLIKEVNTDKVANYKDSSTHALREAIEHNHFDIVKAIVESGAAVYRKCCTGAKGIRPAAYKQTLVGTVTESIHTHKEIFCIGYSTDLQPHRKCPPHP
jgi:hypothetical protein